MRTKTIRRFPFSVSGLRGTLICLLLLCVLPLCGAGKVVRVVLDDNYPPFSFRDSDGVLQGVLIDEWKLWETKTGNHAELTAMDWNEALTRMKNGEFDVIDTIFETPERARFFDFTKPYFRINVPIFFRSDIAGIVDLHSLRGFPVGVKDGDAAVDVLAANGVTNLLKFPAYEDVISAAAHGKINVFIVDEPASLYFLSKMGIRSEFRQTTPVSAGEFHRAVRKGNTELLKTVENGFAKDIAPGTRADPPEVVRHGDSSHYHSSVDLGNRCCIGNLRSPAIDRCGDRITACTDHRKDHFLAIDCCSPSSDVCSPGNSSLLLPDLASGFYPEFIL